MKMSNNPAKYEVPVKQYLRSILDISAKISTKLDKEELFYIKWPTEIPLHSFPFT